MRLLVLFLVCSIGLSYAADSYAQKAMISIDVHNQRVEDILKEIEAQSDFDFFFNNKHVDLNRRVSVSADKSNIFSVLKEIFAGTNVKYSVLDKKIILSVEAQSPQQEKKVTVSGTVLDTHGEPVIGASVLEKGVQGNGTITDIDGIFKLSVSSSKAQLDISYIGYQSQTVAVQVGKNLKIILQEDSKQLEEVVVVGYGTQSKKTLTGAVSMVNMGDVEMNTVPNVSRALAGKAAGFRVNQISAQPGGEAKFRIRGEASTGAGNDPLFVIDGFPVSSSGNLSSGNGYYESGNIDNVLESLNPDDIESINFLKDASAAIYGSKAAGGVVLITTKKAKAGKTVVQYNGSFTGKVVGLQPELMSLDQWADAVITAQTNDGYSDSNWIRYAKLAKLYKNQYIDLNHSTHPIPEGFKDVEDFVFMDNDWQDILWGNSWSTQHDLSVSGGTERNLFRLSLGYMYDNSTLKWGNNNNQRYNMRLNNQFKLSDNVMLTSSIGYNRQDQVSPSMIGKVLSQSSPQPGLPASTIDGRPYGWGTWRALNWWAEEGGDNKLKVSAINISESLNWKIYSDLDMVVNVGYNTSTATREKVEKSIDWYNYAGTTLLATEPTQENSKYSDSFSRTDYYMASGYLNWHKTLAEVHNLSAMAGAQYNYTQYKYTFVSVKDINPSLEIPNGAGEVLIKDGDSKPAKWHEAMMSYFGRLNYDYKQRYLLEGNLRYDGSSKFRPENRWQFFWGVSGGWRLSEESFMHSLSSVVNNLKLRLSYGVLGNQSGVDRYDGTQLYNFASSNGAYIGSGKVSTIDTNGKIVTTDRTWERIHSYNLGVDFAFLNNRLTGTFELFMKKNNNMLIDAQYPGVLGDNAPTMNLGKFEAKGWEGNITWSDKIGPVQYHIGGTITYTTNKLIDLGATSVLKSGFVDKQQGYPLNSYFGLRYIGKIQTQEELEKYKYYYLDGNGIGMQDNIRLGDNMFECHGNAV